MEEVQNRFRSRTESDMRVLFIITIRSHGRGGHVHSLNHISTSLGNKGTNIAICSLGAGKSNILENNKYFLSHIFYNGLNLLFLRSKLKKVINEFKPDIIHFFDIESYNLFSFLFNVGKFKTLLNLCGGPNPKSFPFVENLILFSEENRNWFFLNRKFKDSNIDVIPNRVNVNYINTNSNILFVKEKQFSFVRIARIGEAYKKSIENSIRLIKALIGIGLDNIHLYIIGVVENREIENEIRKQILDLPITLLVQNEFTQKASDMLYLADAVVATGRGVMEAMALGLPVLVPVQNSNIPVLVNESNFKIFFWYNFSQRSISSTESIQENFREIENMIKNRDFYVNLKNFSLRIYQDMFDVEKGVSKYIDVYNRIINRPSSKKNVSNIIYQLRTLYSFLSYRNKPLNFDENR